MPEELDPDSKGVKIHTEFTDMVKGYFPSLPFRVTCKPEDDGDMYFVEDLMAGIFVRLKNTTSKKKRDLENSVLKCAKMLKNIVEQDKQRFNSSQIIK